MPQSGKRRKEYHKKGENDRQDDPHKGDARESEKKHLDTLPARHSTAFCLSQVVVSIEAGCEGSFAHLV